MFSIDKLVETSKSVDIQKRNYYIKQLKSKDAILDLLQSFDNIFNPSISSRIKDMDEYALKLQKNAIIYTVEDVNILGFIAFYANDYYSKTAYIIFIGVHPSARNKGIGKTLLDLCIKTAHKRFMSFLKLEVQKNNKYAISFYKKHGFKFYGEASQDSIYMIKRI